MSTDPAPSLLVSGASGLVRALRWLALVVTAFLLVYLIEVGHGARGVTTPAMASVAAVLGLLLAAGATYVLSSWGPRNRILRATSPTLAVAGVALFLTGDAEASARRYFGLHRAELDGLAWELRRERPFTGSLRRSGPFEGKESLEGQLRELGAHDVRLDGSRTVFVYRRDLDAVHGFVQVREGAEAPARGEAFFRETRGMSYRTVRPLEGSWHYFLASDVPATLPAAGGAPREPEEAPPPGAPGAAPPPRGARPSAEAPERPAASSGSATRRWTP